MTKSNTRLERLILRLLTCSARPAEHPLVIEAAKDLSRLHALQPDAAAGFASLIARTLQEATRTTHGRATSEE